MVDKNNYFILSGFISFSLFFIFIGLFIIMMIKSNKAEQFAMQKDKFISISISNTIIDNPKTKVKKEIIQKDNKRDIVDPIESDEFDIDDLFSDVKTKDVVIKKEKQKTIDAARLQQINKKLATTKENEIEKIEQTQEVQTKSSASEVNEYLAKIQLRVYESFFPPQNSQGHTVKAVIELNSFGKVLDFRILTYSANSLLNEECDKIKDRLLGVNFPVNPDNKSGSYIIKLTSKE